MAGSLSLMNGSPFCILGTSVRVRRPRGPGCYYTITIIETKCTFFFFVHDKLRFRRSFFGSLSKIKTERVLILGVRSLRTCLRVSPVRRQPGTANAGVWRTKIRHGTAPEWTRKKNVLGGKKSVFRPVDFNIGRYPSRFVDREHP